MPIYLNDIYDLLSINNHVKSNVEIAGIAIDSRAIKENELFIAINASNDGHNYVKAALVKSRSKAIVNYVPDNVDSNDCIVVDNTIEALNKIAKHIRTVLAKDADVIAITGSCGKTSTKDMLFNVLKNFKKTACSQKSFNNYLGVPLSLFNLIDKDLGVFEIGTNHQGEILPLASLLEPNIAIITTIGESHIGNFNNILDIIDEKTQIVKALKKDGIIILGLDHDYAQDLFNFAQNKSNNKIFTFGFDEKCDAYIKKIEYHETHQVVYASLFDQDVVYKLQMLEKHNAYNSLAVLIVCKILQFDLNKVTELLYQLKNSSNRGEIENFYQFGKNFKIYNDSYNATPTSFKASFGSFLEIAKDFNKIAIIGELNELGDRSKHHHLEIAKYLNNSDIKTVYCIGNEGAKIVFDNLNKSKQGYYFNKIEQLIDQLPHIINDSDFLFLKGSNSYQLFKIVEHLKNI